MTESKYVTILMPRKVWVQVKEELYYIARPDPGLKSDKESAAGRVLEMLINYKEEG